MMRLVRRIKRETDGEQSVSAISALASLKRLGSVTIGELAEAEGVSRPSMTALVAGLMGQGLVSKEGDASDRRLVRLRPTSAGLLALEESRTRRTAFLAERLRSLDQHQMETLQEAAGILERILEEAP